MGFSPHGIRHSSHRLVVMERKGMVCASHTLASQAGVRILRKGGQRSRVGSLCCHAIGRTFTRPNLLLAGAGEAMLVRLGFKHHPYHGFGPFHVLGASVWVQGPERGEHYCGFAV